MLLLREFRSCCVRVLWESTAPSAAQRLHDMIFKPNVSCFFLLRTVCRWRASPISEAQTSHEQPLLDRKPVLASTATPNARAVLRDLTCKHPHGEDFELHETCRRVPVHSSLSRMRREARAKPEKRKTLLRGVLRAKRANTSTFKATTCLSYPSTYPRAPVHRYAVGQADAKGTKLNKRKALPHVWPGKTRRWVSSKFRHTLKTSILSQPFCGIYP